MADPKTEILGALGLGGTPGAVPPTLEAGPVSPDVLRAQLSGPAPEGLEVMKEGALALIYVLAQAVATTPPYDDYNDVALDIMKRVGKAIDVNEALMKAQSVMNMVAPTAGAPSPVLPTAAPVATPTPTPTPTGTEEIPEEVLEGIEV